MSDNKIIYSKRSFTEYRDELYSLVKEYYPEVLGDISDSSVGSMLIDINAGVADNLSMNTDRAFQETQLKYAQQRSSLLSIAKNLGFNLPNKRASVTVVDISVNIPVDGDKPDANYYPVLMSGAQIIGSGVTFETLDLVDWSSQYNANGEINRSIIPTYDSNGIIIYYVVTKRELVLNGVTNVYKRTIRDSDVVPFFKLTIQDVNVIDIMDVAIVSGSGNIEEPTEDVYKNINNRYHEVEYLAQQKVLTDISVSGEHLKSAKWIDVTKKFVKEFDEDGYCILTFGNGDIDNDIFKKGLIKDNINNRQFLEYYLNNTALGEKLKRNHTLFVRYRTGGGSNANVGVGVLNTMGNHQLIVNGVDNQKNNSIKKSIKVTNIIPAFGGNDGMSIEDIRNYISYNFSSQQRCVTLTDYKSMVFKMPGKYGSPYRINTFKENNKVVVSVLNLDDNGKLTNISTSLLKENIAEYLTNYRMVNDYVEVRDGRIFNIAIDIYLYVSDGNDNNLVNTVINKVREYFEISTKDMNEDIQLTTLNNTITSIEGVNNVIDLKIYNKVGDKYSINPTEQEIVDEETGEIKIINNTLYSTKDSMFEIKYPEKDIRIFLKKRV